MQAQRSGKMFSVVLIIHESCLAGVRDVQIHKPASSVAFKVNQEIFNEVIFAMKVDNASKSAFHHLHTASHTKRNRLVFSRLVNLFSNSASEVSMNTASGSSRSVSAKLT